MAQPVSKKRSTWFDERVSPEQRLDAFHRLSEREQETLKRVGYQPGTVPTTDQMDAMLASLRDEAGKGLITSCREAMMKRDVQSVNAILSSIKAIDITGAEVDQKLLQVASGWMSLILQELELKAYVAFREFPSASNYGKCRAARANMNLLGVSSNDHYPVNPWPRCIVRPPLKPGPYTVVRGDSLSKIAQRLYGQVNLWDAIFESNGYDGHPDHISPGTVFMIHNGP